MRGEWTLTSEGVAAVQSIRSCGSVPRSVDDPRDRESAPCGAPAAPEEFDQGELPCRTPDGDAEPPRSIRRGTSMDRPSRVSTRLAPSDSLVAAASPSIPPRRGPHRLQCVTRPAKRRLVTRCRAGSHVFPSQRPGRPVIAPKGHVRATRGGCATNERSRYGAPASDLRACAGASVRPAPPALHSTQQKLEFTRSSFHRVLVRQFGFLSGSQTTDFSTCGRAASSWDQGIQPPPAKPNASVRSN